MTKANFIKLIRTPALYQGGKDELLNQYQIPRDKNTLSLIDELIFIGAPEPTAMISIYSQAPNCDQELRVYLPLTNINHNLRWFVTANLLCELLCNEKIWSERQFMIEEDGVTPTELSKTHLFEERFDQMIAQLLLKFPSDKEIIENFSEKVYSLKNNLFKIQYTTTEINAIAGMLLVGLDTDEILPYLSLKDAHPDWDVFASKATFCCIDIAEYNEPIAATSRYGFWMNLSYVYCL